MNTEKLRENIEKKEEELLEGIDFAYRVNSNELLKKYRNKLEIVREIKDLFFSV